METNRIHRGSGLVNMVVMEHVMMCKTAYRDAIILIPSLSLPLDILQSD